MKFAAFHIVKSAFKRYAEDRCGTFAITISYFTVLCAIPLVALFAYISTRVLGDPEIAFRSLNIFSDEFFLTMEPDFFQSIKRLTNEISNLGWYGLVGSLVAGSLLFSNLIYAINFI